KLNFTKLMGIEPVNFGSIFLYKNGFRIAPYGDYGVDYFGIDSRHTQKHFGRLGLRDLIGRIEIVGANPNFREISSRDGGLVKNDYYYSMMRCFDRFCLEKLENYVTKINWKIKEDKDYEDTSALENIKSKSQLLTVLADEIEEEGVKLEKIDQEFVNIKKDNLLNDATEKELTRLKLISEKWDNNEFKAEANFTIEEFKKLQEEKKKLEVELQEFEKNKKKLEAELEAERKESLFSKRLAGTNVKEVVNLQHHIDRATDKINSNVTALIDGINRDVSKVSLLKCVEKISIESKKISSIAQFVANANFNVKAQRITKDLNRFIREYIENVHQEYEHLKINKQLLNVTIDTDKKPFIFHFIPLEIIMIIDNLFSNSQKAKSKNVHIALNSITQKSFEFIFADDGKGISNDILPHIYKLGYTTTDGGSGVGLFHVKQLVDKMKAEISVNNMKPIGVEFKIIFFSNET
ncbi:MAG TPA: ATP-binding protein, partial [Chitinophagaceae bacterium]|nr:ATP-binding protein [Chitinophagaceae bacterium]